MMHPFACGENYNREEILEFLGSKQHQSGIVRGSINPEFIAIFSGGRHGKRAGYEDGWGPDGIFRYSGQGTRGDQRFAGLNRVLADHQGLVLLFETWKPRNSWKGKQRFLGEFRILSHEWVSGHGIWSEDKLLIFSLVPIENLPRDDQLHVTIDPSINLAELREQAILASQPTVFSHSTRSEYRSRSSTVARYVLARSNGICEACNRPAPFTRFDGTPYLELHHTRRLADEGPDDILHVAGVCPNCHREAHFGLNTYSLRDRLEKLIAEKEGAHYQSPRQNA